MQSNCIILFLTVALVVMTATSTTGSDTIEITLAVSEALVKVGQSVTFTCRILGIQSDTLVHFNKVALLQGNLSQITKEQISGLTTLQKPYSMLYRPGTTTSRFTISRTTEGSYHVYTLTIDGVQLEDNGRYSCQVPIVDKFSVKQLEVYRVPDSVEFLNRNNSEEVEVVEGQLPVDLTCKVSRVVPHPDVKITVGDRDVTSDFLVASSTMSYCNDNAIGKQCPLHDDYNMIAEPREFRLNYMDNGKTMTCTATMRDFEKDERKSSVILNVKHEPKILCSSPLTVRVNQTDVKLQCTVYANPLGGPENRTWTINRGGKDKFLLSAPARNDFISLTETIDDVNPTKVVLTLQVPTFNEEYFKTTYRFEAINEYGEANAEIEIKRAIDSPASDSIRLLSSSWIIFLLSTTLALASSSGCLFRRL